MPGSFLREEAKVSEKQDSRPSSSLLSLSHRSLSSSLQYSLGNSRSLRQRRQLRRRLCRILLSPFLPVLRLYRLHASTVITKHCARLTIGICAFQNGTTRFGWLDRP